MEGEVSLGAYQIQIRKMKVDLLWALYFEGHKMMKNEEVYTVIGSMKRPIHLAQSNLPRNQTFGQARGNVKDLGSNLALYLSVYLYHLFIEMKM